LGADSRASGVAVGYGRQARLALAQRCAPPGHDRVDERSHAARSASNRADHVPDHRSAANELPLRSTAPVVPVLADPRRVVDGRSASSAAVIVVAAALKVYPAIFALYFVRKRQWTALAVFGATGLAALAVGVALFDLETWRVYLHEVLPRSFMGESNDPYWIGYRSPARP